jgi:hypothetical protein
MGMQQGRGLAAWTWAYSMDMDVYTGMDMNMDVGREMDMDTDMVTDMYTDTGHMDIDTGH